MTFQARQKEHDAAMSNAVAAFESMGYIVDEFGVETNNLSQETRIELKNDIYRDDTVSRIVRFAPDRIAVHPEQCYFIELKTSADSHANHSYELNSFEAVKVLSNAGCPVLLVFNNSQICFASDIEFHRIIVPKKRWGRQYAERISEQYPEVSVDYQYVSAGSRTPFGLIEKDASYLEQFHRFLWSLDQAGHPTHRTNDLQSILQRDNQ